MRIVAAEPEPGCTPVAILIGPGGWLTSTWDQRDEFGQQVPAGNYFVEVDFDVGPSLEYPLRIQGNGAAMVQLSTPRIGTNRRFFLCSGQDGGELYLRRAVLPVSLTPNTLFQGSLGVLGANGTTTAPSFAVPDDPSLIGLSLVAAFFTFDPDVACPVLHVSPAYSLDIV